MTSSSIGEAKSCYPSPAKRAGICISRHGQRHIGENSPLEAWDYLLFVISSGVSMFHDDTVKSRYSFEEPRNLSCGREYRAFYSLRCFAAPASSRQIHPPPFGLPPFGLKGRRFDGQAKRLLYSGQTWTSYAGCPSPRGHLLTGILNRWDYPPECRPLEKGRAKGAGWIDGICTYPLLRSSRLFKADPSPALWAAPFSKGALAHRYPQ